jgi:hypothetical protein
MHVHKVSSQITLCSLHTFRLHWIFAKKGLKKNKKTCKQND